MAGASPLGSLGLALALAASAAVQPFVGEVSSAAGLQRMVAARAPAGELVLLVGAGEHTEHVAWVCNAVSNLHAVGLPNYVHMREGEASCAALQHKVDGVPGLARALGGPFGCAWYEREAAWSLHLKPGASTAGLKALWTLRWALVSRLLDEAWCAVFVLDLDTHLDANPLLALRVPPLGAHAIVHQREPSAEAPLNAGCVFVRPAAPGRALRTVVRAPLSYKERNPHSTEMDQDNINDALLSARAGWRLDFLHDRRAARRRRQAVARATARNGTHAVRSGPYALLGGGAAKPLPGGAGAEARIELHAGALAPYTVAAITRTAHWLRAVELPPLPPGAPGAHAALAAAGTSGVRGAPGAPGAPAVPWAHGAPRGRGGPWHAAARARAPGVAESALGAPSWLFGSLAHSAARGAALATHLQGVDDKLTAMRVAGWWRREADAILLAASAPGEGATGAERRPWRALGADPRAWLDPHVAAADPAAALGAHAALADLVVGAAVATGRTPVSPPLLDALVAAMHAEEGGGRLAWHGRGMFVEVGDCAHAPRAPLGQLACSPPARRTARADRACDGGGAQCAAGAPDARACFLVPNEGDDASAFWSKSRCYASRSGLLDADVRRFRAQQGEGSVRTRTVQLPAALWAAPGAAERAAACARPRACVLDGARLAAWLEAELRAAPTPGPAAAAEPLLELLVLRPPDGFAPPRVAPRRDAAARGRAAALRAARCTEGEGTLLGGAADQVGAAGPVPSRAEASAAGDAAAQPMRRNASGGPGGGTDLRRLCFVDDRRTWD